MTLIYFKLDRYFITYNVACALKKKHQSTLTAYQLPAITAIFDADQLLRPAICFGSAFLHVLKPLKDEGDYSMVTALLKKMVVALMVCNILILGLAPVAKARLISTQEAQQMTQRAEQLARINRILLHTVVQEQMLAFGVEPKDVQDRLAVLTDEELRQLAGRLQDMPAGGDSVLAVVGIIFVVLIILELVGVTNIFTKL